MSAVDIAPLMDSPRWKTLDEPIRAELKNLWESKDTSDDDRSIMLQKMQAPAPPAPVDVSAPAPAPGPGPATPTPWQALKGAFTGEQRLPFQPGAPVEGTDPAELQVAAEKQYIPAPVRGVIEAMAGPSNVLEGIATRFVPGPLKPIAGALAAGTGEGIRQWSEGEPLDWRKMLNEGIWSAVPEVGETVVRHGVRQFARNTPGGKIIRGAQAAEEARGTPGRIFQPKPKAEISAAFEEVERTGIPIDMTDIGDHLRTLSPGKQADTLNILTNLDREHLTGGRYAEMYKSVLANAGQGGSMAGGSIGDLQNLRNVLRQRAEELRTGSPEARQLVRDLQGVVDDTIDFGLTAGASNATVAATRDTLHTARRDWARRIAADDMISILEAKISSTPDLSNTTFRLSSFVDEIRRGHSEATKSINRSLDLTPGARDQFNTEMTALSRLYQNVEMPLSDVQGISRLPIIAGIRQGIGQILLTDWGRKWFHNAVTEGRGTLSPNAIGFLINVARRGGWPEAAEERPIRPAQASRTAPGGPARSTD